MRVERSRGIRVERRLPPGSQDIPERGKQCRLRVSAPSTPRRWTSMKTTFEYLSLSPLPRPSSPTATRFCLLSALPWSRCLLVSGNFATIESLVSNLFNLFFFSFFLWYAFFLLFVFERPTFRETIRRDYFDSYPRLIFGWFCSRWTARTLNSHAKWYFGNVSCSNVLIENERIIW